MLLGEFRSVLIQGVLLYLGQWHYIEEKTNSDDSRESWLQYKLHSVLLDSISKQCSQKREVETLMTKRKRRKKRKKKIREQ